MVFSRKIVPGDLSFHNLGTSSVDVQARSRLSCDIREFNGFDPSGTNAQDSVVSAWLAAGSAAGVPCVGPGNTTVAMDLGILLGLSHDLEVSLPKSFVFKSTQNLAKPMVDVRDFTFDRHLYSVNWRGGSFDNSLGVFVDAAQSNTCLSLSRMIDSVVEGVWFRGASDYVTAQATTDSAITAGDCLNLTIRGNWIRGMGDAGLYFGGSDHQEAAEVGGEWLIIGNHFYQCNLAITFKRLGSRMLVASNQLRDCSGGICAFQATSGSVTYGAGRAISIAHNTAKRIGGAFFVANGGDGYRIYGNHIEDFGYTPSGADGSGNTTYAVSANPIAIWMRGASNSRADHNHIAMVDWTTTSSHTAFETANYDYLQPDGVTNTHCALDNFIYAQNTISNVYNGLIEDPTHGTPGPSFGKDNNYRSVTRALSPANSGSNYSFFDDSSEWRTFVANGASVSEIRRESYTQSFAQSFRTFSDAVGITRIARLTTTISMGTIAAGASFSTTVTLTGAQLTTDQIDIFPTTAAAEPDGLLLRAFVSAADTITVRARNVTGASITPSASGYSLLLLRVA
jgi:hypothetical protein